MQLLLALDKFDSARLGMDDARNKAFKAKLIRAVQQAQDHVCRARSLCHGSRVFMCVVPLKGRVWIPSLGRWPRRPAPTEQTRATYEYVWAG